MTTQESTEEIAAIQKIEEENRVLERLLASIQPDTLEELRTKNETLKTSLAETENQILEKIKTCKMPVESKTLMEQVSVFKQEVLVYCQDRKLQPELWNHLESL